MKFNNIVLLTICLLINLTLIAQVERETRAVWVTTNFKLDWPPNTFDEEEQKISLRNIFQDLNRKKINTVYFQVRSNGSVLFNSNIEPFSHYLTGEIDKKPSYDPLQLAIDLGREFNIEVHAWVNMIRCFSGSDDSVLKHPKHIRNSHPDWTERVMDESGKLSYWMNSGNLKAQDYLVDLLLELSSNYDVDGIHLDFFRYPDKNFNDSKYFKEYGSNMSLGDWRRNNLTSILRKFKERINPKNQFIKIGATPIGIRKSLSGAIGWEGYSSVYQDTETWLSEGLVDYLTPQIYWDIANNPQFNILAKDWVENSFNRNIVLGLAAYKNDVLLELDEMINISRSIGASGVSFFRYGNIADKSYDYFQEFAFPSDMQWKKLSNGNLDKNISSTYSNTSDDAIILDWNDTDRDQLNNFRNYVLLQNSNPIKFLALDKQKLKLKFKRPSKLMYEYQICKLDRLWNFTSQSNIMKVSVPYLNNLKKSSQINSKPILYKQNDEMVYILITSKEYQSIFVDTFSIENIRNQQVFELNMGMNIVSVGENFKSIKKIRITYADSSTDELNFY